MGCVEVGRYQADLRFGDIGARSGAPDKRVTRPSNDPTPLVVVVVAAALAFPDIHGIHSVSSTLYHPWNSFQAKERNFVRERFFHSSLSDSPFLSGLQSDSAESADGQDSAMSYMQDVSENDDTSSFVRRLILRLDSQEEKLEMLKKEVRAHKRADRDMYVEKLLLKDAVMGVSFESSSHFLDSDCT